MNELSSFELDLSRVAERMTPRGIDPARTLRRMRRAERWPRYALIGTATLLLGVLVAGWWIVALALALALLPYHVAAMLTRAVEIEELLGEGDFLEAQRNLLIARLLLLRSKLCLLVVCALMLALLAGLSREPLTPWILAAGLILLASLRLALVERPLTRELEDLGGRLPGGWVLVYIVVLLMLVAPLLMIPVLLREALRALRPFRDRDEEAP